MSRFTIPSSFFFSSCYCYYYLVVAYLAMRQVYITTGFPIIIGYYCCIEARTRKKRTEREREREEEENCPRILGPQIHTHIILLLFAVGFSCLFSMYMLKKIRESVTAFFFLLCTCSLG
jgi:hypothetical protein